MLQKSGQATLSRGHITALDGVRGFAAASVFLFHYGGGSHSRLFPVRLLGYVVHFGWFGVSIFFVLSGFLISGILWDSYSKPSWWKRFYARRSLRIFPLYYLALLIAVVVSVILGQHWRNLTPLWVLALYLGDVPIFSQVSPALTPYMHLEHFWSLAVEEQFYIVWPFLLALFAASRKYAKYLILSLWTLSLLYRFFILSSPLAIDWQTMFLFGRAGELLAGAYLAMLIRGDESERKRLYTWSPILFCVTLPILIGIMLYDGNPDLGPPPMATIGLSLCSLFSASIIGMAINPLDAGSRGLSRLPAAIKAFFNHAILRWFGKISYGIYIYHLLFKSAYVWITNRIAPNLSPNAEQTLLFFVALICTLMIASLSFYTYESFFLRFKDRFSSRNPAKAVVRPA